MEGVTNPPEENALLEENSDVFANALLNGLLIHKEEDHQIILKEGSRPTYQVPYRLSHKEKES